MYYYSKNKKILNYPQNLYSIAKNPKLKYLFVKLSVFVFLLISIIYAWGTVHQIVKAKYAKIDGLYTIIFTKNSKDIRTAKEQAIEAKALLKENIAVQELRLITNNNLVQLETNLGSNNLPVLLHVKIDTEKTDLFKKDLQNLKSNFPIVEIENHNLNEKITAIKNRYNDFLFTLAICGSLAILLLFATLWFSLNKWLYPTRETINLISIIGGNEKNIIDIFGKYLNYNLMKALILGTFTSFSLSVIAYISVKHSYLLEIDNINTITSYSIIILAIIAVITVYVFVRLRTNNVLKKYMNSAI